MSDAVQQPWDRDIRALHDLLDARVEAIAETGRVFKADLEHVPTDLQLSETRLTEIMNEKFVAARESLRAQGTHLTEIMQRIEVSVNVRMNSIEQQIGSLRQEWVAGHNDLKDRVVRQEAAGVGAAMQRGEWHSQLGNAGTIFGLIGTATAIILGIVAWHAQSDAQTAQTAVQAARVSQFERPAVPAPPR